jgi:DNA transposition AAA+ family ATPase
MIEGSPPPSAEELGRRARDFMARTAMGLKELAREVNYSPVTLKSFLAGRYCEIARSDLYLRAALDGYLNARPLPGSADDIPERLIPSWDTRLILEMCDQAREASEVIALEGPPGTSKTSALSWYAAERNRLQKCDSFFLRAAEEVTSFELLRSIAEALGVPTYRARGRVLRTVVRKLRQLRPAVLLMDEAQRLTDHGIEPFETLRDVVDLAHCGCVLAGHFTFLKNLSNGLGQQLEQWLSRIPVRKHLRGLRRNELGRVAREYFGEGIDESTVNLISRLAQARDRNAAIRSRYSGAKIEPRYLSFRRVRSLFTQAERLRKIPGNEKASLRALLRAAAREMMEAM